MDDISVIPQPYNSLRYIGQAPKEEIRRFETELYQHMKPLIEANERWLASSLEQSVTCVIM